VKYFLPSSPIINSSTEELNVDISYRGRREV
jgi:hypothetical protein